MTSFKPFPILNFDGLRLEREPWISPGDAWTSLVDSYVYRGRLRKRPGSSWMQSLGVPTEDDKAPATGPLYVGKLASRPWNIPHHDSPRPIPSTDYNVRFVGENSGVGVMTIVVGALQTNFTNRLVYTLVDEGTTTFRGTLIWDPDDDSGLDGSYSVTFPAACDVTPCVISYETVPGRPIVGFTTFVGDDGVEHNLCFDTRRCWKLDDTEQWWYVEEPSLGDLWSGGATDHFWLAPYDNILVINNGVDAPYKFDPTASPTLQAMDTDIDGDASDDIDYAKMFFNVRGYPVWMATQENGTAHLGRARWGVNGNAELFNSPNDYIDAPSNDIIVTAGFVAGELYVGFRDVGWWRFEFTGDPISPFAWVPLESYLGSVARNGTVSLSNHLLSRTRRGFVAVNRMGEQEVASEVGDLPMLWNPETAYLTQAQRYDESRQVWWAYPDGVEESPSRIAVQQMEQDGEEQWSVWDLAFNALGSYRTSDAPTIDDIEDTIDSLEYRIDDAINLGGFPITVGGDLTGNVFEFRGTASDSVDLRDEEFTSPASAYRTAIPMSAKTTLLNPFPGQQARLGWVDVMADSSSTASLRLRFYKDFETASYKEVSLDLTSTTGTKAIRRVVVNRTALFHSIEVLDESKAGVAVDYLAPWFKPIGRVRETA